MAEGPARGPVCESRTICLPIAEVEYVRIVDDAAAFRAFLEDAFGKFPELFPGNFAAGFAMKDRRRSKKLGIDIRRIELRDGGAWSVRPSFVMPGMTARTADIQQGLFLRKFAVPYWAIAHLYGRNPMFWYRQQMTLGRNSIVGTTVRQAALPQHLLGDEHHQTCDGDKIYLATTVGGGCCLGAELSATASGEDLTAAYGVFREEARNVSPRYAPQTVNTDGWKGTQAAWRSLFPSIVVLQCFLHAWLKIRDRGKHLKEQFYEVSRRVWETYHAPNRRSFSQRIRRLKQWATAHLQGVVLEKILDLCAKRDCWARAYANPGGHRTSNMLDRMMRGMNRYFERTQHLHGKPAAARLHGRSLALLWNFAPWSPSAARSNHGWQSPAERLNQHRYHDNWMENLLISASCGGYRHPPPQKT